MRRLAAPIALSVVALTGVTIAHSEVAQKGNLRIAFDGRLFPRELPRDRLAPVAVRLEGSIRTADGSRPPQLRRISIAVHRQGRLYSRGLPTCPSAALEQTTSRAALAACRGALVGHGRFAANVDFPSLPSIPARGAVLLFNGRSHGGAALLMHIHGSSPVEATFVLPFRISHPPQGDFGTTLSAKIPKLASDLGYVTDIALKIGRRYRHGGEARSFLSASCAAPPGFRTAIFALARGTFYFAGGQSLTTTLARDCRVRQG
jgi:hypothetical protein